MKRFSSLLAISMVAFLVSCEPDPGEPAAAFKSRPKPILTIAQPEPASRPWTPGPNQLPQEFVDAVVFLQAHGLADPRGGAFSKVRCESIGELGTRWQGETEQYGWVLKNSSGEATLVGMDGLLHTSFHLIAPFEPSKYAGRNTLTPPFIYSGAGHGVGGSLFFAPPTPARPFSTIEIEAALFLVAGEPEVSSELLSRVRRNREPIFMRAASSLLQSKWRRAVSSHLLGDDQGALNLATELASLRPIYEKQAFAVQRTASDGISVTTPVGSHSPRGTAFTFLDQVPSLIEDSRRRIATIQTKGSAAPQDSPRVAQMINRLELSNPSRTSILSTPYYEPDSTFYDPNHQGTVKIIFGYSGPRDAENLDLFDGLIECLDATDRLSHRPSLEASGLRVLTIHEMAARKFVFESYMELGVAGEPSIEEIKSWWSNNRRLSPQERVFGALASDVGGPWRWAAASQVIVEGPGRVQFRLLARHSNPSVTDLMYRRVSQILASANENENVEAAAVSVGQSLSKWAPDSSLPTLKLICDYFYARRKSHDAINPDLKASVLTLFEQRIQLGDGAAREHALELESIWRPQIQKALHPMNIVPNVQAVKS